MCACVQELWATNISQVKQYMKTYLKDPLREVEDPYFYQDEVRRQGVIYKECRKPIPMHFVSQNPLVSYQEFLFLGQVSLLK